MITTRLIASFSYMRSPSLHESTAITNSGTTPHESS